MSVNNTDVFPWIHLQHVNTLCEPSVYFYVESKIGSTVWYMCVLCFYDIFHILW
jgi:hypothetical protein